MEEVEGDSDPDYDPKDVETQQGDESQSVGMSQVLASICDLRAFMKQRFNDQDEQFHRWNTNLAATTSDFFLEDNDVAEPLDPTNEA